MNNCKGLALLSCGTLIPAVALLLVAGCESPREQTHTETTTTTTTIVRPTPPAVTETSAADKTIRIDAGSTTNYVDAAGHVWLADQGFADGDVVARDEDMPIANTDNPALYRTEHYDMTSFSENVPNGEYTVKLHFAETYDGVSGPGQRVFSFNLGPHHEFKDFDVWSAAGGPQKAYVVTVQDVDVTDGRLTITFTADAQSPEINAIEIIPE